MPRALERMTQPNPGCGDSTPSGFVTCSTPSAVTRGATGRCRWAAPAAAGTTAAETSNAAGVSLNVRGCLLIPLLGSMCDCVRLTSHIPDQRTEQLELAVNGASGNTPYRTAEGQ